MSKKILIQFWLLVFLLLSRNSLHSSPYSSPHLPLKKLYMKEKIGGDTETSLLLEKRNSLLRKIQFLSSELETLLAIPQTPEIEEKIQKIIEERTSFQEETNTLNKKLEKRRITLYQNRQAILNQHVEQLTQELQNITKGDFQQKIISLVSSSEFNGAVEWAHRHGIIGTGTSVVVMETETDGDIAHSHIERALLEHSLKKFKSHAARVVSVVHEVAPGTIISLKKYIELYRPRYNNTIFNASFGCLEGQTTCVIPHIRLFSQLLKIGDNLLIVAAGNSQMNIEDTTDSQVFKALFKEGPSLTNRIILVGSIDSNFKMSEFSNIPSTRREYQDRFLCTLGNDVIARSEKIYGLTQGTSFAAPAVSGAAALLKGRYPDFSMEEIAAILLESAEKNFFVPSYNIFVYDATDETTRQAMESLYSLQGSSSEKGITRQPFNPEQFGKGVLSLRRAFIYAEIYASLKKERGEASLEERLLDTARRFKQRIAAIDHASASVIQKAFRAWKRKKKS